MILKGTSGNRKITAPADHVENAVTQLANRRTRRTRTLGASCDILSWLQQSRIRLLL